MPMSTEVMVLEAMVERRLPPESPFRAWWVTPAVRTMLPATDGLVLKTALIGAEKRAEPAGI